MVDFSESIQRNEWSVLTSSTQSGTGTASTNYDFPTGIWDVYGVYIILDVANPTAALSPSKVGGVAHRAIGGQRIWVLEAGVVAQLDASGYTVTFKGSPVTLMPGDYLRYDNYDLTSSGTGYWTVSCLAKRLR